MEWTLKEKIEIGIVLFLGVASAAFGAWWWYMCLSANAQTLSDAIGASCIIH